MKRSTLLHALAIAAFLGLMVATACKKKTGAGPQMGTPGPGTPGVTTPHPSYAPPPTIKVPTVRPGQPTPLPEPPG